jgi:hypothetical protein
VAASRFDPALDLAPIKLATIGDNVLGLVADQKGLGHLKLVCQSPRFCVGLELFLDLDGLPPPEARRRPTLATATIVPRSF